MKSLLSVLFFLFIFNSTVAQNSSEHKAVEKACMKYLEGFYEGDTSKLKASLQPSLNKFGFWKDKNSGKYKQQGHMSFNKALEYAKGVLEKKNFPKSDAPKSVEILDIGNSIASAKVTAWWGIDYMLLSKRGNKWMIEQVIWEGPLEKR